MEESGRSPDASSLLTSSSNMCFVLMPFTEPFNIIYKEVIFPSIIGSGLEALRADEIFSPGSIMEQIRSAIQQSRVCIADLTGRNPNVLYELGIAQTLGKPIILMTQDIEDIPFDLKQMRVIPYAKTPKGLQDTQHRLKLSLQTVLGYDRLDEARHLIENGMIRASVAILGVLLEHSLRHIIISKELVDIKNRDHFARSYSIGRMIEMLSKAEIISKQEHRHLKEATAVRNKAVHDLKEPKRQDAKKVFDYIESFIRKYIGKTEQMN